MSVRRQRENGTCDIETLDTLLARRHSCRAFLPDAIDGATITRIIESAQAVPSWGNTQPCQVHTNRATLDEVLTWQP